MTHLTLDANIHPLTVERCEVVDDCVETIFKNPDIIAITHCIRVSSRGDYSWANASLIVKHEDGCKYLTDYDDILKLGDDVVKGFLAILMNKKSISGDFLIKVWDENNGYDNETTYLEFVIMRDFFGLMMEDWVHYGQDYLNGLDSIFEENLTGDDLEEALQDAKDNCYIDPVGIFFLPNTKSSHEAMRIASKQNEGLNIWKDIVFQCYEKRKMISLVEKRS